MKDRELNIGKNSKPKGFTPEFKMGKNAQVFGFSPVVRTGEVIKGTGRRGRRNSNQGRR